MNLIFEKVQIGEKSLLSLKIGKIFTIGTIYLIVRIIKLYMAKMT